MVRRLEAFRAEAVFRFRDAAAFLPAATRLGDFLVVRGRVLEDFLAAVRLRVAAAFRPAVFLVAVFRERVVAAFFAAVFRLRGVAAFRAADVRVVVRFRAVEVFRDVRRGVVGDVVSAARSVGLVDGISVVSERGVGRSHAGVSGRHDGSGVVGESIVLVS